MSILIKNGRIITATDDYVADIYIEGETISAIGKNLNVQADTTIDASGKLVMPGGIDPHVHLDMPFMGTYSSDNYETGTRAAGALAFEKCGSAGTSKSPDVDEAGMWEKAAPTVSFAPVCPSASRETLSPDLSLTD